MIQISPKNEKFNESRKKRFRKKKTVLIELHIKDVFFTSLPIMSYIY